MGKMNLIGGEYIGVKTQKRKPILIEDLLEDNYLDVNPRTYGIYIPQDEILKRPKYQWFAVLSTEELLKSDLFIAKHIKASIIDVVDEYYGSTEIKTTISI